jgi:hypothetical protein
VLDSKGTIIETETRIAVSDLPSPVQFYMKDHYKGSKIKEAAKIVNAKNELNYEVEVRAMDVLFGADGKFIKEVKD